jgi:hypothetical protein
MFKKGDILSGQKRKFDEAYHPVVFIDGPDFAPLVVILTHSDNFPCNTKLSGTYDKNCSYFIAHLIEKMSEWGPYKKISELAEEDINFIETHISKNPITWKQYKEYTRNGCPDHN